MREPVGNGRIYSSKHGNLPAWDWEDYSEEFTNEENDCGRDDYESDRDDW